MRKYRHPVSGKRVGVPLFFNQTGQLSLELALQYCSGVYTIIQSGRDEEEEDDRHLRQFRLTEEETDWTTVAEAPYNEEQLYEHLLRNIESAVKAMTLGIIKSDGNILEERYQRDCAALEDSLKVPFIRIIYEDAVHLLNNNGFPELRFGDDLKANHEAKIVELLNRFERSMFNNLKYAADRPVFIMRYPKEIKFFNMRISERDPRVVLSADLIFPYAGEGVGSAVREHEGDKLKQVLLGSTMFRLHKERGGTYEDFTWYTEDLVGKGKTRPHAGYGLGNERLIQYVLGKRDIRECSLFYMIQRQSKDWEKK